MHEKSTWEAFFDNHAPIYEQNIFTKNTIKEVDFLLDELKLASGASILDVGCGTGRHSVELARRGYAVTGVDLSAGMLAQAAEAAQKAGVQVEWVHSDATRFVSSKQFDAAICLCEGAFGLLGSGDDPIAHPSAVLRNVCRALKLHAKAVFTVLNGYAMARRYSAQDVEAGRFDPLGLVEASEFSPQEALPDIPLRERAFVPTELALLFGLAGLRVLNIWGGTAGNWGRRPIDLDEIEIMVIAQKDEESVTADDLH